MILDEILRNKKIEVDERKRNFPEAIFLQMLKRRTRFADFRAAISADKTRTKLICEIKKASPSAGLLKDDFGPVAVARAYTDAGADALSVLTEGKYFLGRLNHIAAIRNGGITLPILRKDFICDPYQILESVAFGADAVLLIVGVMPPTQLQKALRSSQEYGLAPVVEVHTHDHLREATDLGAGTVEINNRDLRTFKVDLSTTEKLLPFIPKGTVVVSASGVRDAQDVRRLRELGVDAILVGETLMRHPDPAALIREFAEAAR